MSQLINDKENIIFELSPLSCNDFGVLCNLKIETDLITIDYNEVSENDKYLSHPNVQYLKKETLKLNDLSKFDDEELVISIYPIDMFFTMDIYKSTERHLNINLRIPVGVFTNAKVAGYNFGLDFKVGLVSLRHFFNGFISEYEKYDTGENLWK